MVVMMMMIMRLSGFMRFMTSITSTGLMTVMRVRSMGTRSCAYSAMLNRMPLA